MANINKTIRFYQPNDPYYWEVDNLPLADLLSNDITLENRITVLEDSLSGIGNTPQGSFSTGAITDVKGYSEALSGTSTNFGKIFVQPGKFISRVQLPATRDSGWRMSRDSSYYFNNEDLNGKGGLKSTSVTSDFIRETQGVARTAVVEFYANPDNTHKSIPVPSFDVKDFNSADAPAERLDLIYIKGCKSLDTDGDATTTPTAFLQGAVPPASLGIIKGAYFRTDAGAGLQNNGPRFVDPPSWRQGRTTGMATAELPVNTLLPGFGTVPMPEDLINFAWHRSYADSTQESSNIALTTAQIDKEAAFSLPIAYVRVPRGYVAGDPIPQGNVIDIRPFLRTAELAYSERAAVAASVDPNGNNPFITQWHLVAKWINPMQVQIDTNTDGVVSNTGRISGLEGKLHVVQSDIDALEVSVSGMGTTKTPQSLNHEGRLLTVEGKMGRGGGTVYSDLNVFLSQPARIFNTAKDLGTLGAPKEWDITKYITGGLMKGVTAVYFRLEARQLWGQDTAGLQTLYMGGGDTIMHDVMNFEWRVGGGWQYKAHGLQSYMYHSVTITPSGTPTHYTVKFDTALEQENSAEDVEWTCSIVGFIYRAITKL